jgi:hypothetical protein
MYHMDDRWWDDGIMTFIPMIWISINGLDDDLSSFWTIDEIFFYHII